MDQEYCNPHYTLEYSDASLATETGLIALFKLVPDDKALPGFVGRWDDKAEIIDVDAHPLDCIPGEGWKGERDGYHGHHATIYSNDPRVYEIDIRTPAGPVFKARCRLNLNIGIQIGLHVTVGIGCDAVVTDAKGNVKP